MLIPFLSPKICTVNRVFFPMYVHIHIQNYSCSSVILDLHFPLKFGGKTKETSLEIHSSKILVVYVPNSEK